VILPGGVKDHKKLMSIDNAVIIPLSSKMTPIIGNLGFTFSKTQVLMSGKQNKILVFIQSVTILILGNIDRTLNADNNNKGVNIAFLEDKITPPEHTPAAYIDKRIFIFTYKIPHPFFIISGFFKTSSPTLLTRFQEVPLMFMHLYFKHQIYTLKVVGISVVPVT
jgi:hypothetical protein